MITKTLILLSIVYCVASAKSKTPPSDKTTAEIKKILEEHEQILSKVSKSKVAPVKITNYSKPKFIPKIQETVFLPKIIPSSVVKEWATEVSEVLLKMEKEVVRRDELLKGFGDIKMEVRNGSAIVNRMARELEDLLTRRVIAAEEIMRKAEEITKDMDFKKYEPEESFQFDSSIDLDRIKETPPTVNPERDYPYTPKPFACKNVNKVRLNPSKHFNANMSLDKTSVHVSREVFECDVRVTRHLDWSERLLSTFRKNYAQDATTHYQYFCSAHGFLRHYPAALWPDMFTIPYDYEYDIYDCRLRPWYVSSQGAPRDVLILLDASGSMDNSSNQLIGEQFSLALLSALTDDDYVNLLRFNVELESPISCFNDKLVPANHVNSAAMMAAMRPTRFTNTTWLRVILDEAAHLLRSQRKLERPPACQQAIVLLTDSVYENYSEVVSHLDKQNKIRLFIIWLHDPNGVRDDTRDYSEFMTCDRDGSFAELKSPAGITEQVLRVLQVLERPLVAQREKRLQVFSDVYAHVEDPRRSEQLWKNKESNEQLYRYRQLRKNKAHLLSPAQRYKDFIYLKNIEEKGHYYEESDVNYHLQISVSVPVFEYTTKENITIELQEEKQRNSTRTYPVNRLLGVAGVDIPINHLKLLLPYHQLGGGGTLFILDHRGNCVIHDNIKSTFDGDILRPGYRTVDILDLEQPAINHGPRDYPTDWIKFRKKLIVDDKNGNMTMYGKNIFEGGLRVNLEMKEYYWMRIMDHYTAVVVLPPYNKQHIVPETNFTKKIAEQALKTLERSEFTIQPDWLYCQHVEPHFDDRVAEVLHFIRRRSDEPNFAMKKLRHEFLPLPPLLLEKPYQCDQELMAKLCKEALATERWAKEHDAPDTDGDCAICKLGGSTAFFASESGLTRWHQYHATSQHAPPPSGALWSRGPTEPWYRRAVAQPKRLLVHLPVAPYRLLRNSFMKPPSLGQKHEWLTAARALANEKGFLGVAGYHFHPQHLIELLVAITEFPCNEDDKSLCKPRCDESWSCVLIDEGGWVVARDIGNQTRHEEVREHLSTLHPSAMAALIRNGVFQVKYVHDYQAVCFFPPWNSASMIVPSLLKTLWYSVTLVSRAVSHVGTLLAMAASSAIVSAETEKEKEKRRKNLKKNYQRELYDRLYTNDIIINRTVFAACDRSRTLYQLQQTTKALEALSRTPTPDQLSDCSWPVVGSLVPKTNLVLLALYNCRTEFQGPPPPSPLDNLMYPIPDIPVRNGMQQNMASKLACWRNKEILPARPPSTACYEHNYQQEAGYRQCGPWLPDPENTATAIHLHCNLFIFLFCIILTIMFYIQEQNL